jgi:hypothetical protein
MAILFSADLHGVDKKIYDQCGNDNKSFIELFYQKYEDEMQQKKFDDINFHIILGDAEFKILEEGKIDYFKPMADWPFKILCVIGNHEPILGIKDLHKFEKDIGIGETVYMINEEKPFIAYLKRGKIYNIDGFRFLVLGGGLSYNNEKRKKDGTWWKNEYWSIKEKWDLFKLLKNKNCFDYVLSHTGPHKINKILFGDRDSFKKAVDKVALMNDKIDKKIHCRGWLCGHWHKEDEYPNDKYPDVKLDRQYYYLGRKTTLKLIEESLINIPM